MLPQRVGAHELDHVISELHQAPTLTAGLLIRFTGLASIRISGLAGIKEIKRIEHLIEAGSDVDAVRALIALTLPQWKLRQLAFDDGLWHCALSRCRALPCEFDQTANGCHADIGIAVLIAFVEAWQMASLDSDSIILPLSVTNGDTLCCDNFY